MAGGAGDPEDQTLLPATKTLRPATGQASSMQDLFGTLDAGVEVKRIQGLGRMTQTRGIGCPTALHTWLADTHWKPPPDKKKVGETMKGMYGTFSGPFRKDMKHLGDDIEPVLRHWKPETLDGWAAEKTTHSRTASRPPGVPAQRFPIHSRPLPEPHAGLCSKMHREWMEEHEKHRDKHVYPVYHARLNLEKAVRKVEEKERMRQMAREIMEQARLDNPEFSEKAKLGIGKMKKAIKGVRHMAQDSDFKKKEMEMEEKRDKELLARAKSQPALQIKDPDPEDRGQVRHLAAFGGCNRHLRSFRESTPWVYNEGMLELHKLGRISKAHLMGRTA